MEIEIFTLADYAADYGNGKLVVIGTFDTIFTGVFPAIHPACSIALRMRVANSESGYHNFEIKILDPKNANFKDPLKGELEVKENPNSDHSTFNIVLNLNNVAFESPGRGKWA